MFGKLFRKSEPDRQTGGAQGQDLRFGQDRGVRGANVYLAARYARRAELRAYAKELEAAGAAITCRWLFAEASSLLDKQLAPEKRGGQVAAIDFEDVQRADICLAFTESGDGPVGRGGRHTELGIALALGRRVVVIGPREHVFHCLPQIEHYENWEDASGALILDEASSHPVAIADLEAMQGVAPAVSLSV